MLTEYFLEDRIGEDTTINLLDEAGTPLAPIATDELAFEISRRKDKVLNTITIIVITHSGYDADIEHNQLTIYTDEIDCCDEYQVELAEKLGVDTRAFSYEVVGGDETPTRLRSFRCHATLGRMSAGGMFEPLVTILGEDYFASSDPQPV